MRELIKLACIVPVYNEAHVLPQLLSVLLERLVQCGVQFQIIIVDDGSTDDTKQILNKMLQQNCHIMVVTLSRNFGQQAALAAGLSYCDADACVLLDADMQDDPSAIDGFLKSWRQGYDVVYAVREQRKEIWWLRWCYDLFYRLLTIFSNHEIPRNAGDFCLLDRKVVEQLRAMPEYHKFLRGMRSWIGFRQIGVPVARNARSAGTPKYTIRKLVRLALDGVFSFSVLPLRIISGMGVCFALIGLGLAGYFAVRKFVFQLTPPGFATLVVITSFFSGIQMIMLGVVGEYVGRILEQVRGRPAYVIASVERGVLAAPGHK